MKGVSRGNAYDVCGLGDVIAAAWPFESYLLAVKDVIVDFCSAGVSVALTTRASSQSFCMVNGLTRNTRVVTC
jgi:hypothetical protein